MFSNAKRMVRLKSFGFTSKFWRQTWRVTNPSVASPSKLVSWFSPQFHQGLFLWPSIITNLLTLNTCNLYSSQICFGLFPDASHLFGPVFLCFPPMYYTTLHMPFFRSLVYCSQGKISFLHSGQ